MRTNKKAVNKEKTHQGAPAFTGNAEEQLKRSLFTCLLWEDGFYEDGKTIGDRIAELVPKISGERCAELAIETREQMKLRHVPLLIVREMARYPSHKPFVKATLARVIQRADELSEFVSIYWKEGKKPLSAQVKKGLAAAFTKFSEYDLAKYNRDTEVKLRDVLFLCHAKPKDPIQELVWKQLIEGKLETPDTWEVELSKGKGEGKKASWERMLSEKKLGALALLRNLRNMEQAGIEPAQIREALASMKTERVLPFRFISAAKYAPAYESELEKAMFKCLEGSTKLSGRTALLIDVSRSMDMAKVSAKSELTSMEAACALAILLRELGETDVFTFSFDFKRVPARRGFALRDAIVHSQPHSGTYLGGAIKQIPAGYDRLIVVTDEQSQDPVGGPTAPLGYMVNVAANQNGVAFGAWNSISGWSEQIARYIVEVEQRSRE